MGVTISCTKTGRTIDMGSGGFLRLRSKISELVGEPWTSHYKALVEERICDDVRCFGISRESWRTARSTNAT